jgi:hypothetical protein
MVYDHYSHRIPNPPPPPFISQPPLIVDPVELRRLLDRFQEALELAKRLDALLDQPDCVDPEKATLEERVARLEELLAAEG